MPVYLDFEDIRDYAAGVRAVKEAGNRVPVFLATPRIQKPSETGYFKVMERAEPDGVLIRNLGAAEHFRHSPLLRIGDFSLNAANPCSSAILKEQGNLEYLTISYDLNATQVTDLLHAAPPEWFELTIHQHMPMFHMEHCVFCTFLSDGTSYKNCGRPCEQYRVQLRDPAWATSIPFWRTPDAGTPCSTEGPRPEPAFSGNSVNWASSASAWNCWTIPPPKHAASSPATAALLDGSCSAARLVRELDVAEQLGTTEGTLRPK